MPWEFFASSLKNGFPIRNKSTEQEIQRVYDQISDVLYEGHMGQIDDVLSAIEGNGSVLEDGKQGRRTLELITSIYKLSNTGATVKLPLQPDDPFYTKEGLLHQVPHFYEKSQSIQEFPSNSINTSEKY